MYRCGTGVEEEDGWPLLGAPARFKKGTLAPRQHEYPDCLSIRGGGDEEDRKETTGPQDRRTGNEFAAIPYQCTN